MVLRKAQILNQFYRCIRIAAACTETSMGSATGAALSVR
jgi:hypothetical protein